MASPYACCRIPECNRPRFERNSVVHDYCGRSHAKEAINRGMLDNLKPPHGTCHRCHLRGCTADVYHDADNDVVHDFCCKRHAELAISRGEWPLAGTTGHYTCGLEGCGRPAYRDPVTGQDFEYCSRTHALVGRATRAVECSRQHCYRLAWVDPDTGENLLYCGSGCADASGKVHLVGRSPCSLPGCVVRSFVHPLTGKTLGYCCEDHRLRAAQRSLGPNTESGVDRTFRGSMGTDDFQLSVLTRAHPDYVSLKDQFLTKWQKPDNGLRVERIFKIQVPTDVSRRHYTYQQQKTNTRRRFHGTSCSYACRFFVDLVGGPCGREDCSVCSICTHGFKLQENLGRTAQMTNFNLRFGQGLYFSSVSGKANDYSNASEKVGHNSRKWRCMFMASVVVGRSFSTDEGGLPDHFCPPQGYDSVVGEVGPNLNFDEVVVYDEKAALPTFLIAYSTN